MWVESTVDSVLGYCPQVHTETRYIQKDEKFYYCYGGEWLEAGLVPHQYTDPRKEGLTDEEYDVLDLPKEASVGDRVGGLLEKCFNSKLITENYDAYFCLHQNYYRYREDGTWTLETWDDIQDDPSFDVPDCIPETEGIEWSKPPTSDEPGTIYKREKVVTPWASESGPYYDCEDEIIDYIFVRSQKK